METSKDRTSERMTIPTIFRRKCEFCPEELDTRVTGVHQYTSGWVMVREGGGGHGISLRETHDRWAHRRCIELRINGYANQQSLF